jgi:hypothetical protein
MGIFHYYLRASSPDVTFNNFEIAREMLLVMLGLGLFFGARQVAKLAYMGRKAEKEDAL